MFRSQFVPFMLANIIFFYGVMRQAPFYSFLFLIAVSTGGIIA
jgi:hypothetical protein